ncbi:MAG: hypothetical protein L6R39_007196 [Caloplaca ligustica]|nr:MAG: hypothetical protein L6R39_007196 [Caloplaca ligustica]
MQGSESGTGERDREDKKHVEGKRFMDLLLQAREELKVEKLFGKEYWGSDGMWAYEIDQKEEEATFWQIADQHPLLRNWLGRVRDEVRKAGIMNAEDGFVRIGGERQI